MPRLLRNSFLTVSIALGTLVLMAVAFYGYWNKQRLIQSFDWIAHTQEVIIEVQDLRMQIKEIHSQHRAYLITGNKSYIQASPQTLDKVAYHLARLQAFVGDSPLQTSRMDTIKSWLNDRRFMDELQGMGAIEESPPEKIRELFDRSKQQELVFMRILDRCYKHELTLLEKRKAASDKDRNALAILFIGLILLLTTSLYIILFNYRRSQQLKETVVERNESLERSLKEVSAYKYALDESAIVAITDQKGIIRHVNDNFCKISKYNRDELIGKDHRIINSAYHSKDYIRNIWTTIAGGKVWKGELRNRAKDGEIYWVDTSIVPFLNDEGKPYQYVAIRSVITERKKIEEVRAKNIALETEVSEKKAELAGIFEKITDGFIVLDKGFRYLYANKKIEEMTGRKLETLIGKTVWDVFPDAIGSETYKMFNKAMSEQKYAAHFDYYPPLDLWQENHIYPSEDGISVFIRDVTAQKRAEQKLIESERIYKTIASNIPGSAIILIDKDYRYFLIEGDLLEKIGYSREALLYNRMHDVIPADRARDAQVNVDRALQGETFSMEINRSGFDLLVRYVPLHDAQHQVNAVMIVSIDITELKGAERKIIELNAGLEHKIQERTEQLAAANRELESFSYSVAHDLRTPLRALSGYATMLVEDYVNKLDDEGKRMLGEMEYNTRKMGTLIDDLLTFSRLGRKGISKAEVDMDSLIRNIITELNGDESRFDIGVLQPVFADEALIRHVLINLISNAMKYSAKKAQPKIKITSDEAKGLVTYSIADNGVGFDMQYADKLFGVFQRLHSEEEFEGTGVGLAIVQRIVNRHGGKVWANAAVNKGATFSFTIPGKN